MNAIEPTTGPSPEPSDDELLAMAYADGELSDSARAQAGRRIATDEAFALRVAHYQRLDVATRTATPPEPADTAHANLAASTTQRTAITLGWLALTIGAIGFYAWIVYEMIRDEELEVLPKVLILSAIAGFLLLLLAVLRNRLRELPHDPYTKIQR